ncbi:lysozyme inhibitor LprI family protein [Paracoccus sp. CPCC 101403]|uniref:Lysozyme inhibitor LprI family protein n=1 Tax=Paracoccus broussonetiae TaxID=3075834 RepID=A0ABU3EBQ9_9RHOB|nr:lysozyme inhibitor LprI family protein [Paracoccus sp. CPCC 101403]MDT1061644.1 lysozyme inhibitor LprI family protein [Paracoccus sp. CPCC 101403]
MIRAGLVLMALSVPAYAGDASGFDPLAIDQCLKDATTQGARADCAGTGMEACLTYAKGKYSGDDPDFPLANCLDASHQAWEAKLTATYDAALQDQSAKGIKPAEMLRQAERSWIAFRDDLCNQARDAAGEDKAKLAGARCIRDETARQVALLLSLGDAE